MTRALARTLAHSPLLARGKRLYEANTRHWEMPLSKFEKLLTGAYLILEDYSKGKFPPHFDDQAKAYAGEVNYRNSLAGLNLETLRVLELRKPYWFARASDHYLSEFIRVRQLLEQTGIQPPARLLELGCGNGWMAEFLALMGFDVTGTSIVPVDIEEARIRIRSVAARDVPAKLRFEVAPMEDIANTVGPRGHYDAVYMFEALHHAFDWRRTLQSSMECLRPGGWLLICSEPNYLHTHVSYRIAKLSNTHEIGFTRGELKRHATQLGFSPVKFLSSPFHFWIKPHWLAAQKPA